jgi:hypothetical protein
MGKAVVKNSSGNTGSSLVPRARPTDWCLTRMRTPMMASASAARQAGHKGATDRIFHLRRSAVHEGTPTHCTRDASRDIKPRCQDHLPAAIGPQPPPSDPQPIGRGARLLSQLSRRSRPWLSDTAGRPIGAVDRNSGMTRCRLWRTCWTGFRSGGTTCPPASQAARRRKRSMPCWNCAVMWKNCRLSSCQRASGGTDDADRWRYRTCSGRANSACHFWGRPHKAAR